jgi:exosortase family protein XrtF
MKAPDGTKLFREFRPAIYFLLTYFGLYLILNTAYAFYVNYYKPNPDPLTYHVTVASTKLLSVFGEPALVKPQEGNMNVPVFRGKVAIIEVFEGCNGVNVMIVFLCFLIAFRGPLKSGILFAVSGIVILYIANLGRVAGLYLVALYYPDKLYFVHKFLFTGLLYGIVFIIWFFWMKQVRSWTAAQS